MSARTPIKALPAGIYCPTVTFFKPTKEQELDIETHVKHMEFLARSGISGVVLQGSTGEAVALTREERMELIRTAKEAWQRVGNPGAIIAGTVGAQSTREAILLSNDAAAAGADYTLVLPPSYFPVWMTPAAIQGFYEELADVSPIPVIIYSFPGVSSGIQMDTDLIKKLARHPNIAGVKHTDHDVGRIAREAHAGDFGSPFTILAGATDYLLGSLAVGGKGAITGMSNIAPRTCAKAFELFMAGKADEALKVAGTISSAEFSLGKGAILGTKYAVAWACNYAPTAAAARRPLLECPQSVKENIEAECGPVVALERQLEKEGWQGSFMQANGQTSAKKSVNGSGNGLVHEVKKAVGAA